MPLRIEPCRKVCDWDAVGTSDGLLLFACSGCASEWVRTEPWTPRRWDGSIPDAVRAELDADGADSAGS